MTKRQPLYPHIPKSRQQPVSAPRRDAGEMRFFPDSDDEISYTTKTIGYERRLSQAFQEAIARARAS